MIKNRTMLKIITIFVFLLCFSSAFAIGYAYFDNTIKTQTNTMNIGDWGIPITTPQEFYAFATKTDSLATDHYYLFNDIDFSGYNWEYNNTVVSVVFRGVLDGNGKKLSNLTLYQDNRNYQYIGIFPKMEGGSVYNLTLDNIDLDIGSNSLKRTALKAGLIAGEVIGSTNTISNITIIDCGVRGTSSSGAGGLVGSVTTSSTVLNINNIKATNLKVFNKSSNTGGIIGAINSSRTSVNISDIDIEGEVYSYGSTSQTGGIIGRIAGGGKLTINRAIVEMTSRNTLETSSTYYNRYSNQYLGGFIGRNESSSSNVFLYNAFFTGGLVTNSSTYRRYIGTAIGRSGGSYYSERIYYANVLVRLSNSSISTNTTETFYGYNAELVSRDSMPNESWWNTFKTTFISANNLWTQDSNGRLTLIR